MNEAMAGYRLKTERAKRLLLKELQSEIAAFHALTPYTVYFEDDPAAQMHHVKVRVNEQIPAEWGALVGDIIHNLRAALDLLAVAIVQHCDPNRVSYNHVHFIVGESEAAFRDRLPKNIAGASAKAIQLIENLRPYKGGEEILWRLHQLDILDKHKAIIPVGASHHSVGVQHKFPTRPDMTPKELQLAKAGSEMMPMIHLRPAAAQFPLQDGAIVFSWAYGLEDYMRGNLEFAFDIVFGADQILDGEPVVTALGQMGEFVEALFEPFEREILHR